jgi:hypothetical protein
MKTLLGIGAVVALAAFAAGCTITNNGPPSDGASNGSNASNGSGSSSQNGSSQSGGDSSGANGNGGGSASDGGGASSEGGPTPVSTNAASVSFGVCPTVAACGGDIHGVWDYTGGCIADPFAAFKKQCPSATESNVTGSIVGTVNVYGSTIERNGKASFSGTLTIPAECTMGASCAIVQQTLKGAADSIVCSGSTSCDCVITGHVDTGSVTSFTQSGNTVTTDDGSTYDVCVAGGKMTEEETDANAAEPGVFELTKR